MDPFWQVALGTAAAGVLITIFSLFISYRKESKEHNEKQGLATASIIVGLSGLLLAFIGSIVGIILGLISMKGKKYTALSKIGIAVSVLTLIPWLLVIFLGP